VVLNFLHLLLKKYGKWFLKICGNPSQALCAVPVRFPNYVADANCLRLWIADGGDCCEFLNGPSRLKPERGCWSHARQGRWWNGCRFCAFDLRSSRAMKTLETLLVPASRQCLRIRPTWRGSDETLSLSVSQQRPRSVTEMFKGSYANAFRFRSQLWEFRFGSRCWTSIHTFLFIISVLLYDWALCLTVRFRA